MCRKWGRPPAGAKRLLTPASPASPPCAISTKAADAAAPIRTVSRARQPSAIPADRAAFLRASRRRLRAASHFHPARHLALCLYTARCELGHGALSSLRLAFRKLHQHSGRSATGSEHHGRAGSDLFRHALCRARHGGLARNRNRGECGRRGHSHDLVVLPPRQLSSGAPASSPSAASPSSRI